MIYTAKVEEDENGMFVTFPDDMLAEVGWKEGDRIDWKDNGDGSFTLTKKDTKLVLVETVLQYRMRYVVEVPASNPEWALDTVTLEEAREFSQLYLGETITSHRVISDEEMLKLCDEDNDYLKSWSEEQKYNTFVTTWEEQKEKDEAKHSKHYYDTERNK